jgi:hypothetical protein
MTTVLESMADLFSYAGAAGFAQCDNGLSLRAEAFGDALDVGGFTAAFAAFKRNKCTGASHENSADDSRAVKQGQGLAQNPAAGQTFARPMNSRAALVLF